MSFTTDKQTLEDCNIFGRRGEDSIYAIFNRTHTRGGAGLLEQMFQNPLADAPSINRRSGLIRYLQSTGAAFPFPGALIDMAEQYLAETDERSRLSQRDHTLGKKLTDLIAADRSYKTIYKGITALIGLLTGLRHFIGTQDGVESPYRGESEAIGILLQEPAFEPLFSEKATGKIPYSRIAQYDVVLRFRQRDKIKKILHHIYLLDVYISVARVAAARKFIFPKAFGKEGPGRDDRPFVKLEGLYHPQLASPVANSIHIAPDKNIVFLTGANMAGKSTFMKSLSIALFLAHMGFPVAAEKMEFTALDGLYTTINLPDNLGMGVSHFYAEVLRIKKMAKELSLSKNLFILFDELFRGTNVKDAYEATVAITAAFAQRRNCLFVVSTHIIEAGELLKEKCDNIRFLYLPTRMDGNRPVYSYKLENGITDDRHGMVIINNEGILDILKAGKMKRP